MRGQRRDKETYVRTTPRQARNICEDNATTKKHMREQHRDSGVYVRVYVVFYLAIKYLMLH